MNRSPRNSNTPSRSPSWANENMNAGPPNPWGTNVEVPSKYLYMNSSEEEENYQPTNPVFRKTGRNNYNVPVVANNRSNVAAVAATSNNLPPPPSLMQQPSMIEVQTPVNLSEKFRRMALGEAPRGVTRIRNVATGEWLPQPVNVQLVPRPSSKGGYGRGSRRRRGNRKTRRVKRRC